MKLPSSFGETYFLKTLTKQSVPWVNIMCLWIDGREWIRSSWWQFVNFKRNKLWRNWYLSSHAFSCIFCFLDCNNTIDNVCRRKIPLFALDMPLWDCVFHWSAFYPNFNQSNWTQCLWSTWEMSWGRLEPWSWTGRKFAEEPRARGILGHGPWWSSWAAKSCPAQDPGFMVQFRTWECTSCLQGVGCSVGEKGLGAEGESRAG